MPIYTVEIDGKQYDIEGDRPPTEAEARAAVASYAPPQRQATPPPPSATIGMMQPSTMQGDPKPNYSQRVASIQQREARDAEEASKRPSVEENFARWDARAAEMRADTAEHPWKFAGEMALAAAPVVAPKVPGILARGLGISKPRAAANMDAALKAGEGLRVPLNKGANDAAMRAKELTGTSNSELNRFFDRLTNPKVTKYRGDDLAVREAQDFVMKLGALSADDATKLPPAARPELTKLVQELRAALTGSLDDVGKGAQYTKGVREYRRAAKVADMWEKAKPMLKKLGYAIGAGGAAGAGYKNLTD